MKTVTIKRVTKETKIKVELDINGAGKSDISTTIKFFDHMLATVAKHGFFNLVVNAEGDLSHHIIEDVGITLGDAFKKALGGSGEREKTARYGFAVVPMDESIARCAVDIGSIGGEGRSYTVFEVDFGRERVEDISTENIEHFISSFATHANLTIHIYAKGKNEHHKIEAIFKAVGIALDKAIREEERRKVRD